MKKDDDIQVILFEFMLKQIVNFTSSLKINLLSEMSLCTVTMHNSCVSCLLFEIIALVQQSFSYSTVLWVSLCRAKNCISIKDYLSHIIL